jgi:hypothetical protein
LEREYLDRCLEAWNYRNVPRDHGMRYAESHLIDKTVL